MNNFAEDFQKRTKKFSMEIIKFSKIFPNNFEADIIEKSITKSYIFCFSKLQYRLQSKNRCSVLFKNKWCG